MQIQKIELTQDELSLYNKIPFFKKGFELALKVRVEGSEASARLVPSLLQRKAILEIRLRYFVDPRYNPHSKKSYKEIFEINGTLGEDICRHPHFWPFMYYWIHGPNLPDEAKVIFMGIVREETFFRDVDTKLHDSVRVTTRKYGLNPKVASDECIKLSLECGIEEHLARLIRDYVRAIR